MIFTADDIQTRLRREPFVPLRIVTTTGQTYDVADPKMVMIGTRSLFVGTPSIENPAIVETASQLQYSVVTELRDLINPLMYC